MAYFLLLSNALTRLDYLVRLHAVYNFRMDQTLKIENGYGRLEGWRDGENVQLASSLVCSLRRAQTISNTKYEILEFYGSRSTTLVCVFLLVRHRHREFLFCDPRSHSTFLFLVPGNTFQLY